MQGLVILMICMKQIPFAVEVKAFQIQGMFKKKKGRESRRMARGLCLLERKVNETEIFVRSS